jgi:hypothetical protein
MRVASWGKSRHEHAPFPVIGGAISLRTKRLQIAELTCNPSILFWRLHPDLSRSLTVLQCNDNSCESAFRQPRRSNKEISQQWPNEKHSPIHIFLDLKPMTNECLMKMRPQCLSNLTRSGPQPTSSSRTERPRCPPSHFRSMSTPG